MQAPGGHIFPRDAVFAAKLLPLPWGGVHPPARGKGGTGAMLSHGGEERRGYEGGDICLAGCVRSRQQRVLWDKRRMPAPRAGWQGAGQAGRERAELPSHHQPHKVGWDSTWGAQPWTHRGELGNFLFPPTDGFPIFFRGWVGGGEL